MTVSAETLRVSDPAPAGPEQILVTLKGTSYKMCIIVPIASALALQNCGITRVHGTEHEISSLGASGVKRRRQGQCYLPVQCMG
jgi:hypothetical protein